MAMLVIEEKTIMFPQAPHAYGPDAPYMTRRRWDYFVRNLAGVEPPH